MEAHFTHTRAEVDSALDGELASVRHRLNELWFRLSDVSQEFSDAIEQLWESHKLLSRMMTEMDQPSILSSDDPEE